MSDNTRILLVESSRFFLTMETQFLNRMPLTILEASSSDQALDICRSSLPPGLIYLASDLTGSSAINFCHQIKNDPDLQSIPIIMICNEGEIEQQEMTSKSGCDAVLFKPLDKNRFLEIGRSFLAGFREKRRPCLMTVRLRNGEDIFAAKALDISSGGIFLKHADLLPVGTMLDLDMNLICHNEIGPRMTCTGRVAWQNTAGNLTKPHHPVGFGIKFMSLPGSTRDLLHGFLRTLDATLL